jgi:hypothetical protein
MISVLLGRVIPVLVFVAMAGVMMLVRTGSDWIGC